MNLFFGVFHSFVLLPNSMSKFIHTQFDVNVSLSVLLKLLLHTCMQTNNRVCVLVRYFVVLDIYL